MKSRTRLINPPESHFFLLGPRGTGKTTWIKDQLKNIQVYDLLDTQTLSMFSVNPERLRQIIESERQPKTIVIYEIQKLPSLLDIIHRLIVDGTSHRFILTGSSTRRIRREGVNLLGGRAGLRVMHPYMAVELGEDFDIDSTLETGLVPLVYESTNRKETLANYNNLYIREEVFNEGLIRRLESFSRFLEAICFSQGSVLNVANVARECQVKRTTVESYITILEDILLAYRLPVFTKRSKRQLVDHPKFYFFDVGVFRANRPHGPLDNQSGISGVALETLVAQHLRAWCDYAKGDHKLYYWRTKSKLEVDFVVYGSTGPWAIEVKSASNIHSRDLRGLKEFSKDYPEAKCMMLHGGRDKLKIDGILCLPVAQFLKTLTPERSLFTI